MGAQLRVYRRRIKTVQSTKKITKAMELIAASRIAKARARMDAARPYAEELTRALAALGKNASLKHPMLTGVDSPQRAGVLVVTSDRGLAGGYNANVLRLANELTARLEGEGKQVVRYVIGRKGTAYYRFRRVELAGSWTGFSEQPNFLDAREATDTVVSALVATSEGEANGRAGHRRVARGLHPVQELGDPGAGGGAGVAGQEHRRRGRQQRREPTARTARRPSTSSSQRPRS